MNTRYITRRSFVASTLALAASRFVAPQRSFAQTPEDPLGIGPGTPVTDQMVSDGATAFAKAAVESIALMDGTAANFLSANMLALYGGYDGAVAYFTQYAFPTEFFSADNVLSYGSGHLSVDVNYSGGSTPGWYNTQRFFLVPTDVSFALDYIMPIDLNVEGMNSIEVDVGVSDNGVVVSNQEVLPADVLVLNMSNTSASVLSVGVYVLPEGVDLMTVQAQLMAEVQLPPSQGTYQWLGGAPVGPATPEGAGTHTYGFMVEPGTTYFLQQFVLGSDNVYYPLEGQTFVTAVTVAADAGK